MSLTTRSLRLHLLSVLGAPLPGAKVTLQLSAYQADGVDIVPLVWALAEDVSVPGDYIGPVWPNTRGDGGTHYELLVQANGLVLLTQTITVLEGPGEADTKAKVNTPPYPAVYAAEVAVGAANTFADAAGQSASRAQAAIGVINGIAEDYETVAGAAAASAASANVATTQATAAAARSAEAAVAAASSLAARAAAELARDASSVNSNIFATGAAGVVAGSGVAAGKYYWVRTSGVTLLALWQNVGGVATDTGVKMPSSESLDRLNSLSLAEVIQPNVFTFAELDLTDKSRMVQGSDANVQRVVIGGQPFFDMPCPIGGAVVARWRFPRSAISSSVDTASASVLIDLFELSIPSPRTVRLLIDQYVGETYIPTARRFVNLPLSVSSPTRVSVDAIAIDPTATSFMFVVENAAGSGAARAMRFHEMMLAGGNSSLFRRPAGLAPASKSQTDAIASAAVAAGVAPFAPLPAKVDSASALATQAIGLAQSAAAGSDIQIYDPSTLPSALTREARTGIFEADGSSKLIFARKGVWRDALGAALAAKESEAAKLIRLAGGCTGVYIRPNGAAWIVGQTYGNGYGAEYGLGNNVDGFMQAFGAKTDVFAPTSGSGHSATNLVGITQPLASGNAYTTAVGSTWDGEFYGDGFVFSSYADDRGGDWEFEVDREDAIKRRVFTLTTWASPAVSNKRQTVTGLERGSHTVRAKFLGANPLHAPSTLPARGWFIGTSGSTLYDLVPGPVGAGKWAIHNSSITVFAVTVQPVGVAVNGDWVPSHGPTGSTRDIVRAIYIDGVLSPALPSKFTTFKKLRIEQLYGAYNTNDVAPLTKVWDGLLVLEYSAEGLRIENYDIVTHAFVSGAAYLTMLPAALAAVDHIRWSNGVVMPVTLEAKETLMPTVPTGAIFYAQDGSCASGVTVRSVSDLVDPNLAGTNDPGCLLTQRLDGVTKAYWRRAKSITIPAGAVLQSAAQYAAVGGIDVSKL
jgi:hypothetical protein